MADGLTDGKGVAQGETAAWFTRRGDDNEGHLSVEHCGFHVQTSRVIVYGTATGQRAQLDPGVLYAKGASVHGLWLTYLSQKPELMRQAWQQLSTWAAQGHLRPVIEVVSPMEKAEDAYRLLLERKNFGKVVLTI